MEILRDFTRALLKEWAAFLAGAIPMVAIAMTTLIHPEIAPLPLWIWVVLIFVVGFSIAAFRVYATLHGEIREARERLRPKIKCTFRGDDRGCVAETKLGDIPVLWVRVKIETDSSELIRDCRAVLLSISRDNKILFDSDSLYLPIAPGERKNPETKDIRDQTPEYADLLVIDRQNHIAITTPGFKIPNTMPLPDVMFGPSGHYTFKVVVSAPGTKSVVCYPRMKWSGDWRTVQFSEA